MGTFRTATATRIENHLDNLTLLLVGGMTASWLHAWPAAQG